MEIHNSNFQCNKKDERLTTSEPDEKDKNKGVKTSKTVSNSIGQKTTQNASSPIEISQQRPFPIPNYKETESAGTQDYSFNTVNELENISKIFSDYNPKEIENLLQLGKQTGLSESQLKTELLANEAQNLLGNVSDIFKKIATEKDERKSILYKEQRLDPLYKQANDITKYVNEKLKSDNITQEEKEAYCKVIDRICLSLAVAPNGDIVNRELYNNYVENLKLANPDWERNLKFTQNDANILKTAANADLVRATKSVGDLISNSNSLISLTEGGKAILNEHGWDFTTCERDQDEAAKRVKRLKEVAQDKVGTTGEAAEAQYASLSGGRNILVDKKLGLTPEQAKTSSVRTTVLWQNDLNDLYENDKKFICYVKETGVFAVEAIAAAITAGGSLAVTAGVTAAAGAAARSGGQIYDNVTTDHNWSEGVVQEAVKGGCEGVGFGLMGGVGKSVTFGLTKVTGESLLKNTAARMAGNSAAFATNTAANQVPMYLTDNGMSFWDKLKYSIQAIGKSAYSGALYSGIGISTGKAANVLSKLEGKVLPEKTMQIEQFANALGFDSAMLVHGSFDENGDFSLEGFFETFKTLTILKATHAIPPVGKSVAENLAETNIESQNFLKLSKSSVDEANKNSTTKRHKKGVETKKTFENSTNNELDDIQTYAQELTKRARIVELKIKGLTDQEITLADEYGLVYINGLKTDQFPPDVIRYLIDLRINFDNKSQTDDTLNEMRQFLQNKQLNHISKDFDIHLKQWVDEAITHRICGLLMPDSFSGQEFDTMYNKLSEKSLSEKRDIFVKLGNLASAENNDGATKLSQENIKSIFDKAIEYSAGAAEFLKMYEELMPHLDLWNPNAISKLINTIHSKEVFNHVKSLVDSPIFKSVGFDDQLAVFCFCDNIKNVEQAIIQNRARNFKDFVKNRPVNDNGSVSVEDKLNRAKQLNLLFNADFGRFQLSPEQINALLDQSEEVIKKYSKNIEELNQNVEELNLNEFIVKGIMKNMPTDVNGCKKYCECFSEIANNNNSNILSSVLMEGKLSVEQLEELYLIMSTAPEPIEYPAEKNITKITAADGKKLKINWGNNKSEPMQKSVSILDPKTGLLKFFGQINGESRGEIFNYKTSQATSFVKTIEQKTDMNYTHPSGEITAFSVDCNDNISYKIKDKDGKILAQSQKTVEKTPEGIIYNINGHKILKKGVSDNPDKIILVDKESERSVEIDLNDLISSKKLNFLSHDISLDSENIEYLKKILFSLPPDILIYAKKYNIQFGRITQNLDNSCYRVNDKSIILTGDVSLFTIAHEVGHAIQRNSYEEPCKFFDGGELVNIYKKELQETETNNPSDYNGLMRYFLVSPYSDGINFGHREIFAETNAIMTGKRTDLDSSLGLRTQILMENFPQTIAKIINMINEVKAKTISDFFQKNLTDSNTVKE